MKGSLLGKLAYVFCALAGILAGCGVFALTGAKTDKQNSSTKDNTLIREAGDSVFFDEEQEVNQNLVVTLTPTTLPMPTEKTAPTAIPSPIISPAPEVESALSAVEQTKTPVVVAEVSPTPVLVTDVWEEREEVLPSLGSHWVTAGITMAPPVKAEETLEVKETTQEKSENLFDWDSEQNIVEEAITYPAKIFGQTPVINRSDMYVSYFEFCYDLVSMMEPVVQARGLNINTLMTKFALKALFCGVDIEKLDINAPIPRRLAALCLWLAAQVLNEKGCETSSKSAETYVTDISSCSAAERKAIAYLYEQGVVKGYQVAGQKFYPADGLKTKTGEAWLLGVKRSWK